MASHAERSMSFGAVAGDYDRLRPGPPPEAIDWLLPAHPDVVVDLAAGTGLLTRALAGKARQIIAIEPDARMRSVLERHTHGVRVLAGRGEAIPLPDASADAVLVSSAWHWFNSDLATAEVARILRDGGRLGVIWTGRSRGIEWLRADDWFAEVRAEEEAAARRQAVAGTAPAGQPLPEGADPVSADEAATGPRHPESADSQIQLPDQALFRSIETHAFRFSRYMTVPDIIDMLATYSGVITASPEARAAGRARAAAALAAQFPGAAELEVPMRSRCWRANRVSRPVS
ncbi:MAG: class I SAM-dependent methyltransferase [Streptosporangiaceae bacterium]